jgi:hypothetical protein
MFRTARMVALITLLLDAGCPPCSIAAVNDESTSDFLESESSTQASAIADAGTFWSGPGYQNVTVTAITVSLSRASYPIEIEAPPQVLLLDWPPGVGTFTLGQLDAVVTDDAATSAPLDGTLDVIDLSPVCGDNTCGALVAVLRIPVALDAGGPFISGDARISVHYSAQSIGCSYGLGGGDG